MIGVAVIVATAMLAALAFLVFGARPTRSSVCPDRHAGGCHRSAVGMAFPEKSAPYPIFGANLTEPPASLRTELFRTARKPISSAATCPGDRDDPEPRSQRPPSSEKHGAARNSGLFWRFSLWWRGIRAMPTPRRPRSSDQAQKSASSQATRIGPPISRPRHGPFRSSAWTPSISVFRSIAATARSIFCSAMLCR